ncbi:hypothetical protein [Citrobacter sp. AATXR]|uniref:hypothetical protein n=1 Tax=Citrobacter sp. AATXR TaxID=1779183 RepID=UPI000AFA12A1|nr:hypothetical protein [Citrobacter sp. AATXR]
MQTINNRMTENQIADLFSLAVQLQVKAEESDDRDTAILAYSIQNACSNLTESRREFRAADTTIHNLELKITDMAVQLANAESKCRELAAENAELKYLIEQHANSVAVCPNCSHEEPSETDDIVALYRSLKTPATDAFLAEVRASAVEEFVRMADYSESVVDGEVIVTSSSVFTAGHEFAAQLRKGGAA